MLAKNYLKFTAFSTLIIGLIFFLWPTQAVHFFTGTTISDGSIFIMFLGSSLMGYSALNWFASFIKDLDLLRPVLLGNFVALVIAVPLSVYALFDGLLLKVGVVILIIHTSFALGFYYYIKKTNRVVKRRKLTTVATD